LSIRCLNYAIRLTVTSRGKPIRSKQMSTFYPITLAEMRDFLEPQGFAAINLPNATEYVFARRVHSNKVALPLSLRVYTGIARNGESREVGTDAIRVVMFAKRPDGSIVKLAGSKRVHRVSGWAANLQSRLDPFLKDWLPGDMCPRCKVPMCERKGRNGPFLGCLEFPRCTFTKDIRESRSKRRKR
jgi:hypothetical protein